MAPLASRSASCLAMLLLIVPPGGAQEVREPPDDPLHAVTGMTVHPAAKTGHQVWVLNGRGLAEPAVNVIVVSDPEALPRAKLRDLQARLTKAYGNDQKRLRLGLAVMLGRRFVTGRDGRVMVGDIGARTALLAVRGKDLVIGRRSAGTITTLTLTEDHPVHVLVVGPKGRPVRNAPVGFGGTFHHWPVEIAARTDKHGRAKLRLDQLQRMRSRLRVGVYAATRQPVEQEVDPRVFRTSAEKPIRLQLPEYGSIELYVLGPDQQPIRGVDGALLWLADETRDRPFTRRFRADSARPDTAVFSIVEVGLAVEMQAKVRGSLRPQKVRSAGPRHHRDVVVVRIKDVKAPRRVKGRVLGVDGQPVRSEHLGVVFMEAGEAFQLSTVQTSAQGELEVLVPTRFEDANGKICIFRRSEGKPGIGGFLGGRCWKLADLVRPKASHHEFRLAPEPVIAAGRVVNREGRPVVGAEVRLRRPWGEFPSYGSGGVTRYVECRVVTDEAGRFELRAAGSSISSVVLDVTKRGHVPLHGLQVSGSDARVVLHRAGTLRITFSGRSKFFHGEIRIREKDKTAAARWSVGGRAPNGLWYRGLHPGQYEIEFRVDKRDREPALVVEDVQVKAGATTDDTRLLNLDLTKHLRILKISVRTPDGAPAAGVTVWQHVLEPSGGWGGGGTSPNQHGDCYVTVPLTGGYVSVVDRSRRFVTQRFPLLKKDLVVRLTSTIRVSVRIAGMPALPPRLSFYARLVSPESHRPVPHPWYRHGGNERSTLGPNGRVELVTDNPGRYQLVLDALQRLSAHNRGGHVIGGVLRFPVQVPPPGAAGEIKVDLSPEQLEVVKDWIARVEDRDG